ncbi:hypothetical protein GCM10027296_33420 [Chitinimonas naiadis]
MKLRGKAAPKVGWVYNPPVLPKGPKPKTAHTTRRPDLASGAHTHPNCRLRHQPNRCS